MAFNHTFRTKLQSGIVAEFLPPNESSSRVVIICDGLPSVPAKTDVLRFFSDHGFWVFHMRYRGTWESEGSFLNESPDKDIDLLVEGLLGEFRDVWRGQSFCIKSPEFFVIGSSFGGTAAILASLNQRIYKSVALAPVTDWNERNRTEPLSNLKHVIQEGFGPVYRFKLKDWKKLESGKFFNPAKIEEGFNPHRLMIVHAKNDAVVQASHSIIFCQKHALKLVSFVPGGHLSISDTTYPALWKKIIQFFEL